MVKFCLTEKQKELVSQLESATGAVAALQFGPGAFCVSLEDKEGHSLYYHSALILEEIIDSGELQQYPDSMQKELMRIWLYPKERKGNLCNMLPSSIYGDTLDNILAIALEQAELLKFGWYLSSEEDFCNPFIRHKKQ